MIVSLGVDNQFFKLKIPVFKSVEIIVKNEL